jgi:phospholipid-binding lipoprotein MlaA
MKKILILTLIVILATFGCAHKNGQGVSPDPVATGTEPAAAIDSGDEDYLDEEAELVADPIEPFNKAMYHFNDKLYYWVLKPVAQGYKAILPEGPRTGVSNFFYNLSMPVRFAGCLMQGKLQESGAEVTRFALNSALGFGGFGNPAKHFAWMTPPPEDVGQALGSYGIGNGFYIVWPVFGPSSLRDTFGKAGDMLLDPLTWVEPGDLGTGLGILRTINSTSFSIGRYEALQESALDPYAAFRNAYIQHRTKLINE